MTGTTLARVLDDLGDTLLEVLAGTPDRRRPLAAVTIHDPLDPPPPEPDSLVLAVGVSLPEDVVALVGQPGVAAVVVRAPFEVTPSVERAVRGGACLLGLARGASWTQVTALLRSLLAIDDVGGSGTLGGVPSGDLFSVANAVGALLGAPITIEDRASRILAFSADQARADDARAEVVLGRQVSERFRRVLDERGVFKELYASDDPVYVADIPGADLDRVAARVRAGDEVLGSIWVAVDSPLSEDRSHALVDAAKLVALHLLRDRAGADVERRVRSDLVSRMLEGGRGAAEAAARLGFARGALVVLALGLRTDHADLDHLAGGGHLLGPATDQPGGPDPAPDLEAEFERVTSAFAMHLSAVQPRSAVAPVGGVVYGLLPVAADDGAERAARVAEEFLGRLGPDSAAVVGIGRVVTDRTALPRSRADADRALRVLRSGGRALRVARADDVHVEALLLELAELVEQRDGRGFTGPLARLQGYDVSNRSDLVDTLRAWLDAFGDVNRAAALVHVHPNTFRYRLKRLAEVGEMDLADPDVRFEAMLQLRLAALTGG